MSVTYTFSDFARPPISSTVLNRLSRALRGRERMAIACAPVLPAPSAAFRAAIAGAPEAPVGRDPGGFGPFRGRGRPRGGSWRPSEPTSRRWVTHRAPGSSAELPSTFSFGGAAADPPGSSSHSRTSACMSDTTGEVSERGRTSLFGAREGSTSSQSPTGDSLRNRRAANFRPPSSQKPPNPAPILPVSVCVLLLQPQLLGQRRNHEHHR